MAKMTMGFGVALVLLGALGFVLTGSAHPTALIPVYFGLALGVCGILASSENPKRRMLWMHIAVTLGLVGVLIPGVKAITALVKAHANGTEVASRAAVHEQLLMALICMVFVVLCVRSFIAARRSRTLSA
jgi:hypothetical protein